MTNFERVTRSPQDFVDNLFGMDLQLPYCKPTIECEILGDGDREIPAAVCKICLLKWLEQEVSNLDTEN